MMTRVLILGATGYIGGHVAHAALGRNWEVVAMRRTPGATGHLEGAPVQWVEGDIDRPETLNEAFKNMELVFHVAGYIPSSGRDIPKQIAHAVQQTRNVLDAARDAGIRRLIYTSSLTTIGRPPEGEARLANESDRYSPGSLPKSAYYECKYAMESEVFRAMAEGLPVVVVNPTVVLGPGGTDLSLNSLLLAIARGGVFFWLGAEMNFVDVRDVALAHLQAAEAGRPGERHILGGENISIHDLILLVAHQSGRRPPFLKLPLWLIDGLVPFLNSIPSMGAAVNHLRAIHQWQGYDCRKAQEVLGLTPRPLQVTINDTLFWFQKNGFLKKTSVV